MSHSTRRGFLPAALAAASPAPGAGAKICRRSGFSPSAAPEQLLPDLFLFADTCNVYVVRDGNRCVLIDFGSGKILDHLPSLGVSRVDWILHTHHHRDQCQGDYRAVERGIPIAVPAHEKHLFAGAENFWRNRRVFHLYYVRNDFDTITENIPVARALADYETFRWRSTEFFVLPTPGHTLGSITLVATAGGKRVAFSGGLFHAPGKIQNLYDTQVNYGGHEGIDMGIYSLERLRERKPELVCPSHGEPMPDPDAAMARTSRSLTDYYRFQTGEEPSEANQPYAVTPHLICHHTAKSTFYAIVSNSGKAMFLDYGSPSRTHFDNFERATATTDRVRFVEHNIGNLQRKFGLKSVDVAMPSHMHDDHMNGFPHLQRRYGTRVWCYENMKDIFENPRGHNLGCILGEPFRVERTFRHGEKFRWEEFEFEVTHSPGHTEHQMAMFGAIDGKRIAFTGDAFFMHNTQNDGAMRHNVIYRNHVEHDSHLKSIRNLLDHEPEILAPGHDKAFPVTRQLLLATEQKLRRQQQHFFDLLPGGETNFGMDPSWVRIYPYQMLLGPGSVQKAEVRVRNYRPEPMKMEVAVLAPKEWRVEPDVLVFEAPANGYAASPFTIAIPKTWQAPAPRLAIAADVRAGGRYLGEITEAVVELA